jgi:hypothetical protein
MLRTLHNPAMETGFSQRQERFIRLYLATTPKRKELGDLCKQQEFTHHVIAICSTYVRKMMPEQVTWELYEAYAGPYERARQRQIELRLRLMNDSTVQRYLADSPSALEVACDGIAHLVIEAHRRFLHKQLIPEQLRNTYR